MASNSISRPAPSSWFLKVLAASLACGGLAMQPAIAGEEIALCPAVRSETPASPEFYATRGMRAGLDGWLFARRDFTRSMRINEASLRQFGRLVAKLEAGGTRMAVALVPSRLLLSRAHYDASAPLTHSYDDLRASYLDRLAQLRSVGLLAPDLLTPHEDNPPTTDYFFRRDHHWTPAGAALAAQDMAAELNTQPFIALLPPVSFHLSSQGFRPHKGSYANYAEKTCHITLEPEQLETFELERDTPASLLDETLPGIVLAGTSFSKEMFGFPAALAMALGREVENAAVDGGGADSALIAFLSSGRYAEHKPALLIWEMPYIYSYNLPLMWRQAVPAAHGACDDVTALASQTAEGDGKEVPLLTGLDRPIQPGRDFLYIESSDAAMLKFTLHLAYADDQSETVEIDRSARASNSGRFFLELSPDYTANLQSVTLSGDAPVTGTLVTRLCEGAE